MILLDNWDDIIVSITGKAKKKVQDKLGIDENVHKEVERDVVEFPRWAERSKRGLQCTPIKLHKEADF